MNTQEKIQQVKRMLSDSERTTYFRASIIECELRDEIKISGHMLTKEIVRDIIESLQESPSTRQLSFYSEFDYYIDDYSLDLDELLEFVINKMKEDKIL
ncbi:MAG: hypothetical protein ACTSPO_14465, partial [Candidatus Heimdallarchaeaceae archaeon]